MRPSVAVIMVAATLALLAVLFCGCGPITAPQPLQFVVIVHNVGDAAYVDTMDLTWWKDGTIIGKQERIVRGGDYGAFPLGDVPDGIEIDADRWPVWVGGYVWGSPDYAGWRVFHVVYPWANCWGTNQ